jgi:glycosyltransferase involved in cell wall biosynthesis
MNILLVTETHLPFISGVSTSTDSIAKYMVSRGHKVTIFCPEPVLKKPVPEFPGLRICCSPSVPDLFYRGKPWTIFPLAILPLRRLIKKNKFDVIHIQEPGSVGLSALILSKIYKIPTVGALHFTPEQIGRMIPGKPEKLVKPFIELYIKFIYNLYTAIMVPTATFSKFLKMVGVAKPVVVVSNGVDTNRFSPGPKNFSLRKKYHISDDDVVFFFLGRLDRDKNVATLVKAIPYTHKQIKLLIVGSGKIEDYLHKLAADLNVNNKIIWITHIDEEDMPGFYHMADCFSIMSPYEVQSIVTLQAIASGLPVIAANTGALPELVNNFQNGYLVDVYDYKTLAKRMDILAREPKMRDNFSKTSRQMSLKHNKSTVLLKLEDLYLSLG